MDNSNERMPEGFYRLEKSTESFRGQLGMDIDEALELMREMAEALAYYTRDTDYAGQIIAVNNPHDETEPARNVLKKFKEWK